MTVVLVKFTYKNSVVDKNLRVNILALTGAIIVPLDATRIIFPLVTPVRLLTSRLALQ